MRRFVAKTFYRQPRISGKWLIGIVAAALVAIALAKYQHHKRAEERLRIAHIRAPEVDAIAPLVRRARHAEAETERIQPSILQFLRDSEAEFAGKLTVHAGNPVGFQNYQPCEWGAVLRLGDLYARGQYPLFRPDPDSALELYRLAAMCPDESVAAMGRAKFFEAYTKTFDSDDIEGAPLPTDVARRVLSLGRARLERNPPRFRIQEPGRTPEKITPSPPQHTTQQQQQPTATQQQPVTHATQQQPVNTAGPQNAHDHGVMTAIKATLLNLPEVDDPSAALEEVREAILASDVDADEKLAALDVLERVEANPRPHSIGVTESQALARVWRRVETKPDATEILIRQLASGLERGIVVCSTGRITRIVGTLDGIDDDAARVLPLWAVREELATLAARTRDEDLGEDEFRARAFEQYVDHLGMNSAIITPLIDLYAQGFTD